MREDVDLLIDRVLEISAEAQPQNGMQQRIVAQIENHTRAKRVSVFDLFNRIAVWPLPIASVITAAIICVWVWNHPHRADERPAAANHVQLAKQTSLAAVMEQPSTHRLVRAKTSQLVQDGSNFAKAQHTEVRVTSAVALNDMRAPSKPAPELTLTAEEHLLVRAVQRGELVLLAQFGPISPAAPPAERSEAEQMLKSLVAPMTSADLDEKNASRTVARAALPQENTSTEVFNGEQE